MRYHGLEAFPVTQRGVLMQTCRMSRQIVWVTWKREILAVNIYSVTGYAASRDDSFRLNVGWEDNMLKKRDALLRAINGRIE